MKQLAFVWACAILASGCSEVVPGTCYPNPAGGAGGGGPVPSTSVVTSTGAGDFPAYPESEPLADGDSSCNDPCMECPPAKAGAPAATEVRCLVPGSDACVEQWIGTWLCRYGGGKK
jgi:hypothetical protein